MSASQMHEIPGMALGRARTLSMGADAEARITQDLARLSTAIDGELGDALHALVLIGSYARGDGSIILRAGELQAGSCYELLTVLRGRRRSDIARIERLSAAWSDRLVARVRLHACTLHEVRKAPKSLTWVDVAAGRCEVLAGLQTALSGLRPLGPSELPAEAGAELLNDAAVGLATSNLDSVGRAHHGIFHGHHAMLLLGDAVLLRASHYVQGLRERATELARVERDFGVDFLAGAYGEAIRYLERPDLYRLPDDFETWFTALRKRAQHVHLQLEASRMGAAPDPLGFAMCTDRLWHTTKLLPHGALHLTLRAARRGDALMLSLAGDERERLTRAAVLLAYAPERTEARNLAGRLLGVRTPAPSDIQLSVRLRRLTAQVLAASSDPLAGARYGRA